MRHPIGHTRNTRSSVLLRTGHQAHEEGQLGTSIVVTSGGLKAVENILAEPDSRKSVYPGSCIGRIVGTAERKQFRLGYQVGPGGHCAEGVGGDGLRLRGVKPERRVFQHILDRLDRFPLGAQILGHLQLLRGGQHAVVDQHLGHVSVERIGVA